MPFLAHRKLDEYNQPLNRPIIGSLVISILAVPQNGMSLVHLCTLMSTVHGCGHYNCAP